MVKIATVFGGSGFLGRYVVGKLAAEGYEVRVAGRRPDLAASLRQLGGVGQIAPYYAPVQDERAVTVALRGADLAVNLAAVLSTSGRQALEAVNVEGAACVARLAAHQGVGALVHMSAIGASAASPSLYGRSRAAGEAAVLDNFPTATLFRASVIFGAEDHFFNMFAGIARYAPVMPVYAPATRLQPVYVGDVAEAIRRVVAGEREAGGIYELAGPDVFTMKEIARLVLRMTGRRKPVVEVPDWLAGIQASVMERLPGKMLTTDQLKMLSVDNIMPPDARGFAALGMTPLSVDMVAPAYMDRFRNESGF